MYFFSAATMTSKNNMHTKTLTSYSFCSLSHTKEIHARGFFFFFLFSSCSVHFYYQYIMSLHNFKCKILYIPVRKINAQRIRAPELKTQKKIIKWRYKKYHKKHKRFENGKKKYKTDAPTTGNIQVGELKILKNTTKKPPAFLLLFSPSLYYSTELF